MPSPSPPSPRPARRPALASPRLRRLAQAPPESGGSGDAASLETCELCGAPIAPDHRHLLDLERRELLCACRACSLLFDRDAAGGGHFRLIPQRRLRLEHFVLDDVVWEKLRIPVEMAFFFHNSQTERAQAFYPGPMGATESRLELPAWAELQRANPVLETLEADVEALLVNRVGGERRQWLVPIDDCYRLVATIRTRWRGFSGGKEAWQAINAFFADLDLASTTAGHTLQANAAQAAGEETIWRGSASATAT